MRKLIFLVVLSCVFVFSSCTDDDSTANDNFDRKAMLSNIGNQVIVPQFNQLQEDINVLLNLTQAFNTDPSESNLQKVQDQYVVCYHQWQACNFYDFGPSFTNAIRIFTNSYPTDILTIQDNIDSQDYDLKAASNLNAIGFPALDYLLFGINEARIDLYVESDVARQYLLDVVSEVNDVISEVNDEWTTNYIITFENAEGTDVGSSLGQLVNELTKHVEKYLRDGKIGIPLGIRNLNEPLPSHIEARYKGDISLSMCKANLMAIKEMFNGGTGSGIDDYLNALGAQHIDASLAEAINNYIDNCIEKIDLIPVSLKEAVISNPAEVAEAYVALQQLTVILKNDMTSALGILITYQDNDGD